MSWSKTQRVNMERKGLQARDIEVILRREREGEGVCACVLLCTPPNSAFIWMLNESAKI